MMPNPPQKIQQDIITRGSKQWVRAMVTDDEEASSVETYVLNYFVENSTSDFR